jgi:YbbR domain-containing protein
MALAGLRHPGLKIVSVILAALLWLLVSGEQDVERALRVPLEFTNLPRQLELVGEPPSLVDVRVRGSSGTISRVAAAELAAVLDVRDAKDGPRRFNLKTADVRAPFGVEVIQVAPASVELTFEESGTKIVPIMVRTAGDPAPGFVVSAIAVDPPNVTVNGPVSALSGVKEATTDPVSVNNAKASVTETVTIGIANAAVRLGEIRSARVAVTITMAPGAQP